MPYKESTQKKYGENPLKKISGFKMKGYTYPGMSPIKDKEAKQTDNTRELTKKELKDRKINPKKDTKYLINEKTNVISTSTLVKE